MAADGSRVGTVALVHEDEEIGVVVGPARVLEGRVEFVDDGGDERSSRLDEAEQVAAATRAHGFQLAGLEGVFDLVVQVGPVGDDDDPRVDDLLVERQRPSEHDHRQRLARALGVPDYTALPLAVGANMLDALHGPLDREELLVTGDLADAAVEDREAANQIEEAFRTAEGVDRAVLFGDGARALGSEGFEVGAGGGEVAGVDGGGFLHRQGAVDGGLEISRNGVGPVFRRLRCRIGQHGSDGAGLWDGVGRGGRLAHSRLGSHGQFTLRAPGASHLRLAPALPELLCGADSRVPRLLAVERQQEVGEVEQVRDVGFVLVADQLASGLVEALGGPFVLNDDEGDAVDEGDYVEPPGLDAPCALHHHLGGDVVRVPRGVLPVDVAEGVGLGVPPDVLRDRRPEYEKVVDLLVRAAESLCAIGGGAEASDGFLGILQVEAVAAAAVGETIDREKAVREGVVQEDVAEAAAAVVEGFSLGEWGVAERDEELQRGDLGLVFLGGVGASLKLPLASHHKQTRSAMVYKSAG